MTQTMRLALAQMQSGILPEENAAWLETAIAQAAEGGAQILFTPEMSGLLDRDRARLFAAAQTEADDLVLARVRQAARAHKIWVELGSLAIRNEADETRLLNRSFVIDDQGDIRARYDKIHLFDVDVAAGHSYRESASFARGQKAVTAATPWAMLGLSICYDLRFARLYDALSMAGAEILSVPAAFTQPTGEAHWHVLLRARAIEAGAFVVAAAQSGTHDDGRQTYGHSLVVDPWGTVLLDMGTDVGVGFCDIDLHMLADVRGRIPARAHRRDIARPETGAR